MLQLENAGFAWDASKIRKNAERRRGATMMWVRCDERSKRGFCFVDEHYLANKPDNLVKEGLEID